MDREEAGVDGYGKSPLELAMRLWHLSQLLRSRYVLTYGIQELRRTMGWHPHDGRHRPRRCRSHREKVMWRRWGRPVRQDEKSKFLKKNLH